MFSLIAAVGKHGEIGRSGQLIFHLKEDLQFFKEATTGHPIVMGRKTWDSLPGKLPDRKNIVISSREFSGPDQIIHDLDSFIKDHQDASEEIFIIGGGTIYSAFLPYAKILYLTEVDATDPSADTFFPNFDKSQYDKIIIKEGTENGVAFTIFKYVKRDG